MEPHLIEMEPGGWLAVTPRGAPVPIGVFGATEEDARQRFAQALKEREELHAHVATSAG